MKTFSAVAMGLFLVIGFTSSAEAAIRINIAEVQNGAAFIQGSAAKKSPITWETQLVTTANAGGQFSFYGVVPADCVGTLSDGTSTIEVVVLDCTPVSTAPASVPQTGQTTIYAAGDDGALQRGVVLPTPRFTDNLNGTITDNLTGLIWLKNANCPGTAINWQTALDEVASLNSSGSMNGNNCGDTSNGGNHQIDWRLPNIRELFSLINFRFWGPPLSNTSGTGHYSDNDPFTQVQIGFTGNYWSSTRDSVGSSSALGVSFDDGTIKNIGLTEQSSFSFVLPVRGGL